MAPTDDRDIDRIRAQAAAWLARLRSDSPAPEDRAGFQSWLDDDDRHGAAFETVTAVWDLTGGLDVDRPMRAPSPARSNRRAVLAGVAAAFVVAVGSGIWFSDRGKTYATALGEQRRVVLADGSKVTLDTGTQITVRFRGNAREVSLDKGRAFFDVAHNPKRPFVVSAGKAEVVAVGTAFDVTRGRDLVSVILERGRVNVFPRGRSGKRYSLAPGDRIAMTDDGRVWRDRPNLFMALAWLHGRLGFDHESLAGAVADMNRYSAQRLVIADPAIAGLPVSGLFNAGDNEAFARALETLFPVKADIEPGEILLFGAKNRPAAPVAPAHKIPG